MENNNLKSRKSSRKIRLIVLVSILVLSTIIGLAHQYAKTAKPPGVDALCPFGGLESFITLITTGSMLPKIAISSFILLIGTVIIALIFRRSFCGNICPLGALQELFAILGKKVFKKHFTIPPAIDRVARYLKYVLLLVLVFFSFRLGELFIRPFDPWAAYHHLTSSELFLEFSIGFIVLLVALGGSMIYNRFFCKYLCPMGAALGGVSKVGLFKIKRNTESCIDCKACDKACPVNIKVSKEEKITSAECLNCNECVNSCPVKDTLTVTGPKKAKVSPNKIIFITLIIIVGIIGTTAITGQFDLIMPTLAQEMEEGGGTLDPDAIKGYMSIKEICTITGLKEEIFIDRFNITHEEISEPLKTMHGKLEMEDLRDFVREQLN